ncbi:hypothetical protein DERP_006868 [Dermatophagoides pteronyssinus]|uniref:Uncharacterized protein n=1 Tax=Dermatophagoides pteronyssinus TaxID=6956 RepID=A0ABQ8IS86_DERPT|nr:hypothetical protein DERP_006868 [Dermatophagoides pteronyssinus]
MFSLGFILMINYMAMIIIVLICVCSHMSPEYTDSVGMLSTGKKTIINHRMSSQIIDLHAVFICS